MHSSVPALRPVAYSPNNRSAQLSVLHDKEIYKESETDAEFQLAKVLVSLSFTEYAEESERTFAEERAEYLAEMADGDTGQPPKEAAG